MPYTDEEIALAFDVILRDLLGYDEPEFPSAYLSIAYLPDLKAHDLPFDPASMKKVLSQLIAQKSGVTERLVDAAINSKMEFCVFAAKNAIAWQSLIKSKLSLRNAPISNLEGAKAILFYPGCPKFSDACDYIMETGCDVPESFRSEFIAFFNESLEEEGFVINEK